MTLTLDVPFALYSSPAVCLAAYMPAFARVLCAGVDATAESKSDPLVPTSVDSQITMVSIGTNTRFHCYALSLAFISNVAGKSGVLSHNSGRSIHARASEMCKDRIELAHRPLDHLKR
jgi:hypothetical protein